MTRQKETTAIDKNSTPSPDKAIKFHEARIRDDLTELVSGSMEQARDVLLDTEADWICQATGYERSTDREDMRAGY